jgi:hypothetical protein
VRGHVTQYVGWGAGALLVILLLIGVAPQVIVRYDLHAFTNKLHAGMSSNDVRTAAFSMHLPVVTPRANELVVRIVQPWTFGGSCSTDYAVFIALANDRVSHWSPIKEQLCTK